MKNLPNDHMPKKDSWEKILDKMSFESQLESHIPNLPVYEPEASSWARLTERLDEEKKVVLWPYFSLVAALVGAILIANIVWNGNEDLLNSDLNQHSLTTVMETEVPVEFKLPIVPKIEIAVKNASKSVKKESQKIEIIEVPLATIENPDLELITMETELIIPDHKSSNPDMNSKPTPKTLHEVTISWGLKPSKFQVKTAFGKQDPSTINSEQTGSVMRSRRIRIGEKN